MRVAEGILDVGHVIVTHAVRNEPQPGDRESLVIPRSQALGYPLGNVVRPYLGSQSAKRLCELVFPEVYECDANV
jgi:hypothetical protein